jgi:hypothetical protein
MESSGRHIDKYYLDKDIEDSVDNCQALLDAVDQQERDKGFLPPTEAGTAMAFLVLEKLLDWLAMAHPCTAAVAQAVKQRLLTATYKDVPSASDFTNKPDYRQPLPELWETLKLHAVTYACRSTYFKLEALNGTALNEFKTVGKLGFAALETLQQEISYWKEQHTRTLFTSWRMTTTNSKRQQKAINARLEELEFDYDKFILQRKEIERLEKRLHEHNNDAQAEAVELRKQLRESMAVAEQLRRQIRITSKDNNQKYRSYEFKEAVAVPWDGGGRQSKQVYIDVLTTSEDGRAVQGNNAMIRFFNAVLMDGRAVSFAEEKGVRIDLIDHFDIGSRGLNAWLCFLHNFFPAHSTQAILRDGLKGTKEQKITTIITILENYGIEPHYTKLIRQLLEVAGEDRLVIKATRFGGAHTFSEAKSGSGFMDREPSLFMERQASSMLASLGNKRLGPDGTGYRVLLVLIFSLFVNPKLKQHEVADEFLAEEANNPVFKAYAEAASLNHEWQRAAMECTFELLCERALPSGSVSRPPSSSGTTSHSQSTPSPKHRFQQAAQSLVAKCAEDKE